MNGQISRAGVVAIGVAAAYVDGVWDNVQTTSKDNAVDIGTSSDVR
jgi:hypothetical protein